MTPLYAPTVVPSQPLSVDDLDHVLLHVSGLWEDLRDSKIFVTGGSGFLGTSLVESFCYANERLALGAHLTMLTRRPEVYARRMPHLAGRSDIQIIRGDVRNFVFPSGKYSFIIHGAAETGLGSQAVSPEVISDTLITGMHRVLEFALEAGAQKFLLVSSGAIYRPFPKARGCVLTQAEAYSRGKSTCEQILLNEKRVAGKIARCFALVGPHLPLDGQFAIGNFIRDALAGGAH
jgi:nucleoside-diphosphate-sugar epimerase